MVFSIVSTGKGYRVVGYVWKSGGEVSVCSSFGGLSLSRGSVCLLI